MDVGRPAEPIETIAPEPPEYRRVAITLLMMLIVISYLDRQIINILAEPIKRDLGLADWQIGVMSGIAFAFLYTIAGIPIARLADHGDRPRIIALSVAVWSTMTIACGWAAGFVPLLLGRTGVGIGEAGLTPTAMSLVMDYSPPEKRASSLAHYHSGVPVGSMCALVLGGLLASAFDWRTAFVIVGIPGLFFAVLALTILREPRRRLSDRRLRKRAAGALLPAIGILWRTRSYRYFVLATTFQAFVTYGNAPFTASFFLRTHGAQVAQLAASMGLKPIGFIGLVVGLLYGIAGFAGVWTGGRLADRFARTDRRAFGTIPAVASLLSIPVQLWFLSMGDVVLALCVLTVNFFLNNLWFGPVYTTQQSVVPPHLRATATAVMLFVLNIIGLGLGPLTVGILSDLFARSGAGVAEGLRYALMCVVAVSTLPVLFFTLGRRSVIGDFAKADAPPHDIVTTA